MSSVEPPPYPGLPQQQQQPQQHQVPWMLPQETTEVNRNGLEILLPFQTLLLQQKRDPMTVLTGVPLPNLYSLKTENNEQIFFLQEGSVSGQDQSLCRPQRDFTVTAVDASGREVAAFVRTPKSQKCIGCCACGEKCLDNMTVESPPGQVVGLVKQVYNGNNTRYIIQDANGEAVFCIQGMRFCLCCMLASSHNTFPITAADGTGGQVASISKPYYASLLRRLVTPGADTFVINMPKDLHLNMKLMLIGVCVLFDFAYFETPIVRGSRSRSGFRRMMMQYQMFQQQQQQQQQQSTQPMQNRYPPVSFSELPRQNQFQHPPQQQQQQF